MSDVLSVLIVDDEPLARERIRTLLAGRANVEITAEAADGRAAVQAIVSHKPDVVFLDVQMPLLDGFEVVAEIGAGRMPTVVFVTAYDEYAIRAFDVHACDYLLKPFERSRFERTLDRVTKHVERRREGPTGDDPQLADQLRELLAEVRAGWGAAGDAGRIVIRSRGRSTVLRVDELDRIEAAGNYARLHVGGESHLLRSTMAEMVDRLPERDFARVSRSAIVRLDQVRHIKNRSHGDYTIIMRDGAEVRASRTYAERLEELLDG